MVQYACNSRTGKSETGGLQIGCQYGLQNDSLSPLKFKVCFEARTDLSNKVESEE